MITPLSRSDALGFIEMLRKNRESGYREDSQNFLADTVKLRSSHKGTLYGKNALITALREDTSGEKHLNLVTSNYYAAANEEGTAMVSAWLYGEVTPGGKYNPVALFGAVLRLTLNAGPDGWKLTEVLISISWVEGDSKCLDNWHLPAGQQGWRPGDAPPVLVSELDSPWHCIPNNQIKATEKEQIEESYSRYSWGIDQNDFSQFSTCYTVDACGQFPPLGPLNGLHSIVGSLKEFRCHWPWMQHFGVPLKITLGEDGKTAEMWVGRLIPGQIINENGETMYGAHYRIELRKEEDLWKFSWSEYVPGWFTEQNPPFIH